MKPSIVKLNDLVASDRKITYGVVKPGPVVEGGVPFVRGGDISNGEVGMENLRTIAEDLSRTYKRTVLQGGELLISLVGNPGEVAIAHSGLVGANIARQVGLVPLKAGVDAEYVKYYLMSPFGKGELAVRTQGSVQQVINLSDLKLIPIKLPELGMQKQISSVLSTYDDLIANNRHRIERLEEAARLLYQEWFVRLRFPGAEARMMTEGVPDGWTLGAAADFIAVKPTTRPRRDPQIRYIPMTALSETGMTVDESATEYRDKPTSVRFKNGDTLFARITPCLENGKTAFVNFLNGDEVACGSTEFIVLRGESVSPEFVYCLARSDAFRDNAVGSMTGSSGRQRVQEDCFDRFMLLKPSEAIATQFDGIVAPMFEQIRTLVQQNARLGEARDLLLPRLMSGEITP